MKKLLHKIPGFRRLDEWTDTEEGKCVLFLLVLVLLLLLGYYMLTK